MKENRLKYVGPVLSIVIALSMILSAGAFLAFSTTITGINPQNNLNISPNNMIKLRYASFDPLETTPSLPSSLKAPDFAPWVKAPHIIQSENKITEEWKMELRNAGVEIISYIPDNALLVTMDSETKARLNSVPNTRWTGAFEPAYKLSPELFTKIGQVTVDIQLFPKATNGYIVKAITRLAEGEIIEVVNTPEFNMLRTEIDASWLSLLASREEVRWISEHSQPRIMNADATQLCQSGSTSGGRPILAQGIDGELTADGNYLIACDCDMGLRETHVVFQEANKVVDEYVPDGSSADESYSEGDHGQHTACTILGDNSPYKSYGAAVGGFLIDGHALAARLIFQDIGKIGEASAVYPPPDYYHDLYEDAQHGDVANGHIGGASVHSNSWGGAGAYGGDNTMTDQYVWDNQDFVICYAAGNSEAKVTRQAEAKNILACGSTTENGASVSGFSNPGPATDGRLKPDVCAPGENVRSASTGSDTDTSSMGGTSMATPAVAGNVLLTQQYYRDGFYPTGSAIAANGWMPSAALVKATLINGAVPIGNIPNNDCGWGRIHMENSLYFTGDSIEMSVVDSEYQEGLITGDSVEYHFGVTNAAEPFKATLVWTDYPGDPSAAKMLVNDLDLTVTAPGGSQYKGNVFSGGWSQTGGSYDDLNNIECVYINGPASGVYTVRIDGTNVVIGPQKLALVVTANFDDGYGRVMMDRTVYCEADTINLRVEDLNSIGATVDVVITGSISLDQETVSIPRTAINSGVYTGSINTDIGAASTEDGLLQVCHGETITATYSDGAPSHDDTATAIIDIQKPEITNVFVTNIMGTSALVTWDTNENADSLVTYRKIGTIPWFTAPDSNLFVNHKVPLLGLSENTRYEFSVESTDWRGRTVTDDRAGNYYTFRTTSAITGGALILYVDDDDGSLSITGHPFEVDWINNLEFYGWTYSVWEIDSLGSPTYTDLNQAPMIIWSCADGYPVIGTDDRASLEPYLDQPVTGSGTVPMAWLIGQDLGWDMCDASGTDQDPAWYTDYMAADYRQDSCNEPNNEDGGRGDEASGDTQIQIMDVGHAINIYGYDNVDLEEDAFGTPPSARFWPDDIASDNGLGGPGEIAFDYNNHNSVTSGNPGDASEIAQQSGGTGNTARIVYTAYSHEMISSGNNGANDWNPPAIDPERAGMLDQTIQWLLGGDHPTIDLTNPIGGENFVGNNINIQWTVSGASTIDVYYSPNSGQEYIELVTGLPGATTNYNWDISAIEDGDHYKVRVVALGTAVHATLTDVSASGDFTIDHGVDNTPPITLPGSVQTSANPATAGDIITLTATIDDTTTGNSDILAAQWCLDGPSWPGTAMSASDGNFNSPVEGVTATVDTTGWPGGWHELWVRGQDAANNWASSEKTDIFIITGGDPYPVSSCTYSGASPTPTSPITIDWTATDNNGLTQVELFYQYNGGGYASWVDASNPTAAVGVADSGSWSFGFSDGPGIYDFYTRATDDAAQTEAAPGTPDVTVEYAPPLPYDVDLSGVAVDTWVFVSFPTEISGDVPTIFDDTAFGDGATDWDYIQWFDNLNKEWKSYSTDKPAPINDMDVIDNTNGFWIHITSNGGDFQLTTGLEGFYSAGPVLINLYTGWNLVGYPSATPRAGDVTLPAEANLVSVYDLGEAYRIRDELKSAVIFTEGNAYWVRVTGNCVWSVDP